ncbi:MAG: hypothetical protein OSB00_13505 [Sphingomonas bacterium]|nr:hypothetical protein [Sphingomonas bacterium]
MATNTGDGYRIGSVDDRTQVSRPDGHWTKRNRDDGRFMDVKSDDDPSKGIAKEPDGRRHT